MKKLSLVAKQYKKGVLTDEMTKHLNANASTAIDRSETLQEYGNPSTTVYLLVKELERLKKEEDEKNKGFFLDDNKDYKLLTNVRSCSLI